MVGAASQLEAAARAALTCTWCGRENLLRLIRDEQGDPQCEACACLVRPPRPPPRAWLPPEETGLWALMDKYRVGANR